MRRLFSRSIPAAPACLAAWMAPAAEAGKLTISTGVWVGFGTLHTAS